MNKDGDVTILHLELIQWLAERLIGNNLAIYKCEYDELFFGSWNISFGSRHNRLKALYDGKENFLSIFSSKTSDSRTIESWEKYKIIEKIKSEDAIEELFNISTKYFT